MLAEVISRDGQQLSASQTWQQALSDADRLALLHAIWTAETTPARHQRYQEQLTAALPPGYQLGPTHQAKWLWRTLRAAELVGLDTRQILTSAIGERELTGARNIAVVVDARIRRRVGTLAPRPAPSWAAQLPAGIADPGRQAYAQQIAGLMDARKERMGEHAAASGLPGPSAASGRSLMTRSPAWTGNNGPPRSAPTANCPATSTPPTRSALSPPGTRTCAPPGTRRWPPLAPSTARTCAARLTGCFSSYATLIP